VTNRFWARVFCEHWSFDGSPFVNVKEAYELGELLKPAVSLTLLSFGSRPITLRRNDAFVSLCCGPGSAHIGSVV